MSPVSSVFHTVVTEYWSQKRTQSESIHSSTILYVRVLKLLRHSRHLKKHFNSKFLFHPGTRAVEAQFQIEAPDPYPLLKRRTKLGMQVVLSAINSVTILAYIFLI